MFRFICNNPFQHKVTFRAVALEWKGCRDRVPRERATQEILGRVIVVILAQWASSSAFHVSDVEGS